MSSTLLLKTRICQKSFQPFIHQGRPAVFTLSKPPQLLSSGRFLCTKDPNKTDGQPGTKTKVIRPGNGRFWDDAADGRGKSFSFRQKPSFPKSVFAAGTAKRTADMLRRKTSVMDEDEDEPQQRTTTRGEGRLQPPDRPLPPAEWKKLKGSLGNPQHFDTKMMSALFRSEAELDVAKSLLTFVAMETGTLSYKLLLRYLTLCVRGGHDDEVLDVYQIMRESFPALDTGACSLFIKSFSRTDGWRETISILQEVKKVFSPSPRNYGDIIAAAVQHGDVNTAWTLYDELMEKGLNPHWDTWEVLFKGDGETMKHQERLLEVLLYMRNNQIYPPHSLSSSIKAWFESVTEQKWTGSWTSASPKGVCRRCGSELESIQLTADEYKQLRDRVMKDVIEGRDVFNKTTPEELEQFKAFVKRKPAFDVVIDGLNVANVNKDRSKQSETLLAVVLELERQGLNILVLGRKHMLRPSRSWNKHDMELIQQKAHCFFTDNISEDDPFLLYATLHSGNHCRFVSRDLMRDHKACLPDGASRRLFFKWQRGHQLVVDGYVVAGRRVRFQSIPGYDTIVQTAGDSWHIPYDDTEDRSSYEVPQRWLCLTRKH